MHHADGHSGGRSGGCRRSHHTASTDRPRRPRSTPPESTNGSESERPGRRRRWFRAPSGRRTRPEKRCPQATSASPGRPAALLAAVLERRRCRRRDRRAVPREERAAGDTELAGPAVAGAACAGRRSHSPATSGAILPAARVPMRGLPHRRPERADRPALPAPPLDARRASAMGCCRTGLRIPCADPRTADEDLCGVRRRQRRRRHALHRVRCLSGLDRRHPGTGVVRRNAAGGSRSVPRHRSGRRGRRNCADCRDERVTTGRPRDCTGRTRCRGRPRRAGSGRAIGGCRGGPRWVGSADPGRAGRHRWWPPGSRAAPEPGRFGHRTAARHIRADVGAGRGGARAGRGAPRAAPDRRRRRPGRPATGRQPAPCRAAAATGSRRAAGPGTRAVG